MAYYVLTCNGYRVEALAATLRQAVGLCQSLERDAGDGYARVVSLDGRIVADAEGSRNDPERSTDAATATGMYDAW